MLAISPFQVVLDKKKKSKKVHIVKKLQQNKALFWPQHSPKNLSEILKGLINNRKMTARFAHSKTSLSWIFIRVIDVDPSSAVCYRLVMTEAEWLQG